jgi:hypothetical protein
MDVRFINTWHDPVKEKEGAASLFDAGAQVVFTGADTGAVADVAQEKGKWGVTYDHPASCKVDRCLTAPYWIWGPEYTRIAEQVKAGTYKAGYEYFDADSKAMGLLGFMDGETPRLGIKDLPAADVQLVKDTLAKMLAGTFTRFDVFAGPIKDNKGNEILAAGEKLVQTDLDQFPPPLGGCTGTCMLWFAEGINGRFRPASRLTGGGRRVDREPLLSSERHDRSSEGATRPRARRGDARDREALRRLANDESTSTRPAVHALLGRTAGEHPDECARRSSARCRRDPHRGPSTSLPRDAIAAVSA